jgi:hypothetical protein
MLTSPARPLILGYGAAIALFDFVVLLPGNPQVESAGHLLIVVAIQALIVWRLLHRSLIAWSLAVLASGSYTVSFVFIGGPTRRVHDQRPARARASWLPLHSACLGLRLR